MVSENLRRSLHKEGKTSMKKIISLITVLFSLMVFQGLECGEETIVTDVENTSLCSNSFIPFENSNNTQTIINTLHEEEQTSKDEQWMSFTATAYCPCEKCCGVWAKNRPDGIIYTASGEIAIEGITIAADWNELPSGTEIEIKDIGSRIVQDKGGAIKGNRIDVYFENHQEALNFGVQEVLVRVKE